MFSNSPNIFKVTFGFGPAVTPFIRQIGFWYLVFGSRYVVVGICYHSKPTIPRANWYSVFGCCYFCSYFAHDQIWQALCSWTGHGSKVHQIRECRTVFPSLEHFLPQNIFLPPKNLNLQNISFSELIFAKNDPSSIVESGFSLKSGIRTYFVVAHFWQGHFCTESYEKFRSLAQNVDISQYRYQNFTDKFLF